MSKQQNSSPAHPPPALAAAPTSPLSGGSGNAALASSPESSSGTVPSAAQSPVHRGGGGFLGKGIRSLFSTSNRDKNELRTTNVVTNDGSISQAAWEGMNRSSPTEKRMRTIAQLQEHAAHAARTAARLLPSRRDKPSPPVVVVAAPAPAEPAAPVPAHGPLYAKFQPVMKHRNLQVSTLEGIWHESKDMLAEKDTREPTLRALIQLTQTQLPQIGLALRHTFFEKIREIGCEELTVKWLSALSQNGHEVKGFEKAMDFIMADWVGECLRADDHPQAVLVLQLAREFIRCNSPFACEASLQSMVRATCVRACRTDDPLIRHCLDLIDAVLKYSEIPRSELLAVVSTVCCLVSVSTFANQAWLVARALLTSQLGHRTRKHLIDILRYDMRAGAEEGKARQPSRHRMVLMMRGAVFCLANANWGVSQVEAVRSSPANVMPAFEAVLAVDPAIAMDVLLALRRLITKYGRDLQQMSWQAIIQLFHTLLRLVETDPLYQEADLWQQFSQLMDVTEQLQRDGHFTASPELLFSLVERCADRRPDSSVLALIDYRVGMITPLRADWIEQMLCVVRAYTAEGQGTERRIKAVSCMQSFYMRWRGVYEHELVTRLMLPALAETGRCADSKIQYQMLAVLFDVAKTVSLKDTKLFEQVMCLIGRLFNDSIECKWARDSREDSTGGGGSEMELGGEEGEEEEETEQGEQEGDTERDEGTLAPDQERSREREAVASVCGDNVEIMAYELSEVLAKRWQALTPKTLGLLVDTLTEHMARQYKAGWRGEAGADVRVRVLASLLAIHACPVTDRLQRLSYGEDEPQVSMQMWVAAEGREGAGLEWSTVCDVVVTALQQERWWTVLRALLQYLGRTLESIRLIRTAGEERLDRLTSAVIGLHGRCERGEIHFPKNCDWEFDKYLPPVLAVLLNYNLSDEKRTVEVCRVLVDCVRAAVAREGEARAHEGTEALLACDVAVQLVPDAFAGFARQLLESLHQLSPTAIRAIPLIELLSDAVELGQFHHFFQLKQFERVVDVLAPYTVAKKFNAFIVAAVHRILMRWFARVPIEMRSSMQKYIEEKIREAPFNVSSMGVRQPSGDGRQLTGNNPFYLGGTPETPPPMGGGAYGEESSNGEKVAANMRSAMSAFFRLGRIEDDRPIPQLPAEGFSETSADHYIVHDSVITLKTFVQKRTERKEGDGDDDVFAGSSTAEEGSPQSKADQRRRYQSAVQPRGASGGSAGGGAGGGGGGRERGKARALDDLYAAGGPHRERTASTVTVPTVCWTQLIVRHMYGHSGWLMRAVDELPEDMDRTSSLPSSALPLVQHVAGWPEAVKLPKTEQMARSLRNLDRVSGVEQHAIGVVFIAPGQTSEQEMLGNTWGSERYARFLRLLGSPMSLESCPGGLVHGKHGTYTYAHSDELTKLVFLVATLMPRNARDPQCNEKKKLIANNFVSVIWNESGAPFKLGSVGGKFAYAALEVVPRCGSCVSVQVHLHKEIACWLSLRRALLTDEAAVRMIRKLVIRAQLSVNVWRSLLDDPSQPYLSSAVVRLRTIHQLRDKAHHKGEEKKEGGGGGGGGGQENTPTRA